MAVSVFILAGFAGCKNDGDDINVNPEDVNAYLSVNVVVANDSGTKGAETNPSEPGTTDESRIEELHLHFFDSGAGTYVSSLTIDGTDLVPGGSGSASHPVKLGAGTYKVLVIANGNVTLSGGVGASLLDQLSLTRTHGLLTSVPASTTADKGLVMASRTPNGLTTDPFYGSAPYVELVITTSNTKDSPALINVEMERTVAKLTITGNEADGKGMNGYEVAAATSGECVVTISDYLVVNVNKTGYVFRNTAKATTTDIGYGSVYNGTYPWSSGNPYLYVWDPNSADKIYTPGTGLIADLSARYDNAAKDVTTASTFSAMPASTAHSTIGYCLENTAVSTAQRNGYSTGLVFKGKVVPTVVFTDGSTSEPYTSGTTVFYSTKTSRFYKNAASVALDAATGITDAATITGKTADVLETLSIREFVNGDVYYVYWIKHENDAAVKNQIMEFAIVRNNVYKMEITDISKVGAGGIVIDPNDPNELEETYFTVELKVSPWGVRTNDIEF